MHNMPTIKVADNGDVTITFNAKAKTTESKGGKSLMVASTSGAVAVRVPGVEELVRVSLNAYIPKG